MWTGPRLTSVVFFEASMSIAVQLPNETDRIVSTGPDQRSISDIGESLRRGDITSVSLTRHFLERIRVLNPLLNAFVTVTEDLALDQAKRADAELSRGIDFGPLHGVPIALKDNIDTKGIRTTYGSVLFKDHAPDQDANVVSLLRAAGAVFLGKTALHEFAYGMSGINPHFGATKNPWREDHDAGGSSSGSAAAVAAGLCVASIGTDTGGSVRQPAHCCGVVGYKPTFGLISKSGVFPLVRSMDHVGPITASVSDAMDLYKILVAQNPSDHYLGRSEEPKISDLRIGVIRQPFFDDGSAASNLVEGAIEHLERFGATLIDAEVPNLDQYLIAARSTFAEANTVLWDLFSEHRDAFGSDVADRLETSEAEPLEAYQNAQLIRADARRSIEALFSRCDVLVLPTSTVTSAPIHARPENHSYLSWRNCGLFNFTGHPAISLPAGKTSNGLPVGLMVVGSLHSDDGLLEVATSIEKALNSGGSLSNV